MVWWSGGVWGGRGWRVLVSGCRVRGSRAALLGSGRAGVDRATLRRGRRRLVACAVWLSLAVGPGLASVFCSGEVACARARCGAQLGVRWLWGLVGGACGVVGLLQHGSMGAGRCR